MGRVVKAVLVLGLVLVAAPTGWGSLFATNCHSDGCLGVLVLWAVGLLLALLMVLGLITRGLVIRWKRWQVPSTNMAIVWDRIGLLGRDRRFGILLRHHAVLGRQEWYT